MDKIIFTKITKIGDPYILVFDNAYYHYSTSSSEGFKVFKSTNLIDFDDLGLCYSKSKVGFECFWAPEVYFFNNLFYMLFTSRNKETGYLMLSLATSQKPEGPFVDLFDKPTYDFGYASIDGHIFKDTDNRYYLYYAKDCSQNIIDGVHTSQIYGVELKENLYELVGEPTLLLTPSTEFETIDKEWTWNEGPSILKHNNIYYLSYSTNMYSDRLYSVCYAYSTSPLKDFKKAKENPILTYIPNYISGPGHNSYFYDLDNNLMTAYHIHTDYDKPSGDRRTCFSKVKFLNDKLFIDYK